MAIFNSFFYVQRVPGRFRSHFGQAPRDQSADQDGRAAHGFPIDLHVQIDLLADTRPQRQRNQPLLMLIEPEKKN